MYSSFVAEAVKIFEQDDRVAAYALSDAYNGPQSDLTNGADGSRTSGLTATGNAYLSAIKSVGKVNKNARRRSLREHAKHQLKRLERRTRHA